ncbi:tetratricopeptide repeat protein [Citreimonas sp.]|uniref:tetratricopeptide repeat protein n=1 Tax=Citreimonas sp. TaxID=3036715 RepID=UPI0035C83DD1
MKRAACLLVLLLSAVPALADTPVESLRTAAEGGDMEAALALAERYASGDGVLQNHARAAQWYAIVAWAGDATAANRLGRLYHAGLGVPRDARQAIALLDRAAESGEAEFLHDLALVLEAEQPTPDALTRAADLHRRAAELGHADAAVSLGVLYQNGTGVPRDPARAAELYRAPAEAGHPRAQNNLGSLYVRGDGVAQDYDRAAALFAAAAAQGLPGALTNLGTMYENGFGVPLDEARAAALYRQAAEGRPDAMRPLYDPRLAAMPEDAETLAALDRAAEAGDPVAEFQLAYRLALTDTPQELRRAADLFERAARAGHGPAMANLALLYRRGAGVPQDYVLAQAWLSLAASSGFVAAAATGADWPATMTPDQLAEAQALAETLWQELQSRR